MTASSETADGARIVRVSSIDGLPAAVDTLGPSAGGLPVVLIGGASRLDAPPTDLAAFFRTSLIPALNDVNAVVVDGGTDAGVMRLMGDARSAAGAAFRLVGVAAEGTISHHGDGPDGLARLAAGHPEFVLVPGETWGDESPWLVRVAEGLTSRRAVVLLVNGGDTARSEAAAALASGRHLIALAGSGRAADAFAGRTTVRTLSLTDSAAGVRAALEAAAAA